MTYKNAKTILFAGLIAAMILPFSGMQFATAEEQTNDKITKLVEYKKELKSQLKETDEGSEKNEINIIIKRVTIILELYKVKEYTKSTALDQEFANNYSEYLIKEIDNTFDGSDSQIIESVVLNDITNLSTANFQTSIQSKFNCDTISTQTGYNWGTVTGIDFIESYVVGVQGYPSSIAIMENNYCTEKNFDNGYVKYRNLATGGMCTGVLDDSSSVSQGYCYNFGVGAPVLITAFAWYDGLNPFNTTEGWDFIWVP